MSERPLIDSANAKVISLATETRFAPNGIGVLWGRREILASHPGDAVIMRLSADTPGARVKDLYEVCGQAQKSARWRDRPNRMFAHMLRREKLRLDKGQSSRFEHGNAAFLKRLKASWQDYRYEFDVRIIQPGLSRAAITEEGMSRIQGAAPGHVRTVRANFLDLIIQKDGSLKIDEADECISGTLIAKGGKLVHKIYEAK